MRFQIVLLVLICCISGQLHALEAGVNFPFIQQSLPTSLERKTYNLNLGGGTSNTAQLYQIDDNTGLVSNTDIDRGKDAAKAFRVSAGAGLGFEFGFGVSTFSVKYQIYGVPFEKMQQGDWAWSVSLLKYDQENSTSSSEQVYFDNSGSLSCVFFGICTAGYYPAYSYDAETKADEFNVTGGVKISPVAMLYGSLAQQDIELTLDYQDIKHDVRYIKTETYNILYAAFGYYRKFTKTLSMQAEVSGKLGDSDIDLEDSLLSSLALVINFE